MLQFVALIIPAIFVLRTIWKLKRNNAKRFIANARKWKPKGNPTFRAVRLRVNNDNLYRDDAGLSA